MSSPGSLNGSILCRRRGISWAFLMIRMRSKALRLADTPFWEGARDTLTIRIRGLSVLSARRTAEERLLNGCPPRTGVQFATLVDPSVMRSDRIAIGEGTIICAGAILTVDITIGKHVIINLDCTVGHDALIGDFVTLYPSVNISGNTVINDEVEFGTGSQIIQGKEVGSGSIIGPGAVVVRDIPQGCTAVGLPARPIKFHHVD